MKVRFNKAVTILVFLYASAFLTGISTAQNAALKGIWKGTWTQDGDSLPVTMTFAKTSGSYTGSFDSDALQVVGIPLSNITEVDGNVHFEIKGDQTTSVFDGKIAGEALSGTYRDGNTRGSFQLTRAAIAAVQVHTQDVKFSDKDVTLAGTLVMPPNQGKHTAIVFLHGSGAEGRWANHYLAQKFAERGVVALIYDKRGVGGSTGDWRQVGFDALAADAVAAVRFLQSLPGVDPKRVGIYGHSQGGTYAPLVGVLAGDLSFVIASAASGIDPAECEVYSVENSIDIHKLSPSDRIDADAYVRTLVETGYGGKDHAALDALATKYKGRTWFFAPPPPDNSYWTISQKTASFEPPQYWQQIKAPVLLMYGAHDERVPAQESATDIEAALERGGNNHVTVKMYSDADHLFHIVDPPNQHGWPKAEPDYAKTLVDWVVSLH